MGLTVADDVFERFPGMGIAVAVAHDLDNASERPEAAAAWRAAWDAAGAAADSGHARQHPRVAPWRDRFRAIGVSPKEFPSSVEALLRRALKGGAPFRINPLVDFYNTVSLRHVVPAGGFDLGQLDENLELRLTRAGDRFQALDAPAPEPVPPGEVAYADGPTVLTRHFVWRQSWPGLITADTRSVVLLAEILAEAGEGLVDLVLADLAGGLRDHFGVSSQTFVLDRASPAARW